jgi:integrase/recombinase XerD
VYCVWHSCHAPHMLTIYRRHLAKCRFKKKGRTHRHCNCPISVEGRLEGKLIRRSLDVRSWEAAQKRVREWEAAGTATVEIPSIEDAAKRFIEDLTSRGLSPDTIRKFEMLQEEVALLLPSIRVDRVTADDLGRLKEGWKVRPSTAIKRLERLRSFFKFCVDRDWISKNPARALRAPKEITIVKKPYDAWELEKIDWAIPLFPIKGIYREQNRERINAFISVLRWTGLRIRDVVQLKRSAVDKKYITVRTHKNGKPVQLPVHPEVNDALSKMHGGDYFFWSGEGNPKSCVGDWQRTLRRLGILAGVHIHAHRWRHTFATQLLSKGVPVSEVAAILGNSPRIVEKHYSQWISSRQTALEAAVKGTW